MGNANHGAGELRLPLQVGTSSLLGFAHASAAFLPGFFLIGSIAIPAMVAPWDDALAVYPHLIMPYVFAFSFGLGMIAYSRKHFRLAFSERPSDILLGPNGFRIEGGPRNGFQARWADIEAVKVVGRHEKLEILEGDDDKKKENFWRLLVELRDGDTVQLGSAEDPKERESLEALRDSIRASIKRSAAPAEAAKAEPKAPLQCHGCGAPIVPAETETVPCKYCGTQARIPDDVRARIHAASSRDANQKKSEKLVEKLVNQPGALRTSFFVFLAAIPSMLAWPAALLGCAVLYALCYLRFWNGLLLAIATIGVIAALYYLVRGQLTDRQALRLLTLGFAARAPKVAGGAHHCRKCNGPLAPPPGSVLAHCAYCGVENVLGLDARGEAKESEKQASSLDEALFRRQSERARWRFSAIFALVVLAICTILVRATAHPPQPLAAVGESTKLTRITYDPFNEFQPKFSPDGSQLLYDLRVPGEDSDESIMHASASGAFRGTEMTAEKVHAIRPLWLANGKGFLYVSSTRNDVLRRVDSLVPYAPARDLYTFGHDIDVPSLAPDGKHFVFAAANSSTSGWTLYVGTIDGQPTISLGGGINPAWSPDEQHIAYSFTTRGYRQIWVMTFDGAKVVDKVQLTKDSCDHEDPVYSPDGTYIAYVGNCGRNSRGKKNVWDLYAMKADGTSDQQLTDGQADVETPAWHGDSIYFSANVAGNYDIWRVTVKGSLAGHGTKPAYVAPLVTAPPAPMASGQDWIGTYTCAQGITNAVLHVSNVAPNGDVDAVFEFNVPRRSINGSFRSHGTIASNGALQLTPGDWVTRPRGYVTVGLNGTVHDNQFTGNVAGPSCTSFWLTRR